jgi:hypothetical protein
MRTVHLHCLGRYLNEEDHGNVVASKHTVRCTPRINKYQIKLLQEHSIQTNLAIGGSGAYLDDPTCAVGILGISVHGSANLHSCNPTFRAEG